MTKIVSIGETCLDYYLNEKTSFVGGRSLNFAVQARRCGATARRELADTAVSLISRVGTDEAGRQTLALLDREAVDHRHVQVIEGATSVCDIELLPNADRVFPPGGFRRNVLAGLRLSPAELAFVPQHAAFMTIFDYSEPLAYFYQLVALPFAGLRAADFDTWSDYAAKPERLQAVMAQVDLAFISGDEATVEALRPFSETFAGLVVVTLGAKGSVALANGRSIYQPAMPVANPVDATGCGDAFQAAFTVEYLQSGDVALALQRGTAQATAVLQHLGAISGANIEAQLEGR